MVRVHYRWHPLYGRRVRRYYSERRASGEVVHVEAAPGVVTVVAAWMLEPLACAGMEIGAPRVALAALVDLHHLLIAQGFRGCSLDDANVAKEDHDESAKTGAPDGPPPADHAARLHEASRHDLTPAQRSPRAAGPTVDGGRGRRGGGERR
jgi:hypothetical protein